MADKNRSEFSLGWENTQDQRQTLAKRMNEHNNNMEKIQSSQLNSGYQEPLEEFDPEMKERIMKEYYARKEQEEYEEYMAQRNPPQEPIEENINHLEKYCSLLSYPDQNSLERPQLHSGQELPMGDQKQKSSDIFHTQGMSDMSNTKGKKVDNP